VASALRAARAAKNACASIHHKGGDNAVPRPMRKSLVTERLVDKPPKAAGMFRTIATTAAPLAQQR